jgi:hypothetical protein
MAHDSRDPASLRRLEPYVLAPAAIAVALCLEFLLSRSTSQPSLMALSLAVAVTTLYGGIAAGSLALILAALGVDYFLFEPKSFLTFGGRNSALLLTAYAAGWFLLALLVERTYRRNRFDRRSRLDAERLAAKADRLAQLTAALGQTRTAAAVIETCVQEPLHGLNADAGMFLLISSDGSRAELARAVAYNSDDLSHWNDATLDDRSPVSDAVGRGAPVIVESRARANAEYPDLPLALYPASCAALVAVPLMIGSRIVAVIRLDFRKSRSFSAEDREYLFSLASNAAQALDRTWQYESAQRARLDAESLRARADQELGERQKIEGALRTSETQYRALAARTSRLHGLTAALSESVTLHAVAQAVVHQGRVVVGATTGEVMLLADDRTYQKTHRLPAISRSGWRWRRDSVRPRPSKPVSRYSSARSANGRSASPGRPPSLLMAGSFRPPPCRSSSKEPQ